MCPPRALQPSHYSLTLPLWLASIPCRQLLILERSAFTGLKWFSPGLPPRRTIGEALQTTAQEQPRLRAPTTANSGQREPLKALLRFVGLQGINATALDKLRRLPTAGAALDERDMPFALNPLTPQLRSSLEAYFSPFQLHFRHMIKAHKRCVRDASAAHDPQRTTL